MILLGPLRPLGRADWPPGKKKNKKILTNKSPELRE
jgi:hypothetical protein